MNKKEPLNEAFKLKASAKITPEQLHNWYLDATRELNLKNFNPVAQKYYCELTKEQQSIDIYICKKILERQKSAVEGFVEDISFGLRDCGQYVGQEFQMVSNLLDEKKKEWFPGVSK